MQTTGSDGVIFNGVMEGKGEDFHHGISTLIKVGTTFYPH